MTALPNVFRSISPVAADSRIGSVTYRSRANGRPSARDMQALLRSAQQRNRAAGLSGTLLYEDGRYFQCIEGPPEALAPVWDSIQSDPRHRDITVLSMRIGTVRMFGDWDMRWLSREHDESRALDERAAPSAVLARQIIASADPAEIAAEIDRKHPNAPLSELVDHVLEPTARALGDAWMRDDIDDSALTIALQQLHFVLHQRAQRQGIAPAVQRRLLATTMPGEPHLFGAVAASELHINAGWFVDLDFPESIDHLAKLVAAVFYDRVDIATSDAFDRSNVRDGAAALASLIQKTSRNPEVDISFGGRAFWRDSTASGQDHCFFRSSAASLGL